jgi:peptidyl-prolyl cis-trans isomerase A (cyclophilin A)
MMKYLICIQVFCIIIISNALSQNTGKTEEIVIKTEMGDIIIRLDLENAPVTSANFLRYIDSKLFDSACFYRVVRIDNQPRDSIKIEVIQGGRYRDEEKGFSPIQHETTILTGIRHRKGTISMARSKPGTATSEFFICVSDQTELDYGGKRNPDGQGFAAFGKVVKGMDIVKKIQSINAPGQYLEKPIIIYSIQRSGESPRWQ